MSKVTKKSVAGVLCGREKRGRQTQRFDTPPRMTSSANKVEIIIIISLIKSILQLKMNYAEQQYLHYLKILKFMIFLLCHVSKFRVARKT